jgi:hypothetical protein
MALSNDGQEFSVSHLPRLETVRELEAFDGPILSQLRALDSGKMYIEKWCARDLSVTRSLIVRTSDRMIAEYLDGRVTLIALLAASNDGFGVLVDKNRGEAIRAAAVRIDGLPERYLPKPHARHRNSLRPPWESVPHTFILDAAWDARLLARIEKQYGEVASFSFFGDPLVNVEMPANIRQSGYDHGYQYFSFFDLLRKKLPYEYRPETVSVAVASPGALTIVAPYSTAARVARAVSLSNSPAAQEAYAALHFWSKLHETRIRELPSSAVGDVRLFCDAMRISAERVLGQSATPKELLAIGKVLAAYYRRSQTLGQPDVGVELLFGHPRGVER